MKSENNLSFRVHRFALIVALFPYFSAPPIFERPERLIDGPEGGLPQFFLRCTDSGIYLAVKVVEVCFVLEASNQNTMKKPLPRHKGMSLMELLIVVAVIGL